MDIALILPLGFVMGFVTAVSGGAGVFAVPTMLAFGLPPVATLALNRISDLGVLAGALKNYSRCEGFNIKLAALVALPLTAGGFAGANFSVSVPPETLKIIILVAVVVGIFLLLCPLKPKTESAKVTPAGWLALIAVGFWSGAVGMAGATFGVLVMVLLLGRTFLAARAIQVAAAVPETIISVIVLCSHSVLDWRHAAVMFAASLAGSWTGSKTAISRGSTFIRKAMVAISLVMMCKVAADLFAL